MSTYCDQNQLLISQLEINQISACVGTQPTVPFKAAVKSSGRPKKNDNDSALEAALIMQVALAIKLGRRESWEQSGFTEKTALRFVMQRRRGLTGQFIGNTVLDLLFPIANKTAAAVRLVVDHGAPIALAARCLNMDKQNLHKAVNKAKSQQEAEVKPHEKMLVSTTVTNFNFNSSNLVMAVVREMYFSPRNTTILKALANLNHYPIPIYQRRTCFGFSNINTGDRKR